MKVIIDYGSGNLHSVYAAFSCNCDNVKLTSNLEDVKKASHIILPGVGAFKDCMDRLSSISGMIDVINQKVMTEKTPFFGICVGMQMMLDYSYEHGKTQGFGWIEGEIIAIERANKALKIPHIGWNNLQIKQQNNPIMKNIKSGDHAYFVHSYHAICKNKNILATVDYGGEIVATIAKDNMIGTQFHPEKSQSMGKNIIHNFLAM